MPFGEPWRQHECDAFESWYVAGTTQSEVRCRKRLRDEPLSSRLAVYRQVERALRRLQQHSKIPTLAGNRPAFDDDPEQLIAKMRWLREEIGPLS
jgi:hypothetical protein